MREISFVKRLKFNFAGSVTKRALAIGDADNDQVFISSDCCFLNLKFSFLITLTYDISQYLKQNELVCANLQGELAIFKGPNANKFAYASDLGMVTACVIGDVLNSGMNYVTAINMEGWLFIFDVTKHTRGQKIHAGDTTTTTGDTKNDVAHKLEVLYDQRMPANCKELLLADLDGDGQDEVIIGLTDRVLRTYKWVKIGSDLGKFVGLYKWEFADQIGSVSLNPSRHENCQDILVAQPGGTYAKLECFDKSPLIRSNSNSGSLIETSKQQVPEQPQQLQQQSSTESTSDGDNVKTEYVSKLTPEYHQLALAQMRNHHISTEVLGGIKNGRDSQSYTLIVIATLDGTLMLVNKDEILWSLQVDHQLFALAALDSPKSPAQSQSILANHENTTPTHQRPHQAVENQDRSQYFVACAWNGKTYIIDEQRNYLRFKFDEAVSAFTAGNYYFDKQHHSSLVYATFNNQIILYYDVVDDNIRPDYLLNEILNNQENEDLFRQLESLAKKLDIPLLEDANQQTTGHDNDQDVESTANQQHVRFHNLLQDVLYSISDDEFR